MSKKLIIFSLSIVSCAAIGILALFLYNKFGVGFPCVFHEITGLYCAGCGMTRAVNALSKFEFYQAFRYNLFVVFALPFIAIYFLVEGYYWVLNRQNRFDSFFRVTAVVVLVGLLAYGVLRNIPEFSWLAPTKVI